MSLSAGLFLKRGRAVPSFFLFVCLFLSRRIMSRAALRNLTIALVALGIVTFVAVVLGIVAVADSSDARTRIERLQSTQQQQQQSAPASIAVVPANVLCTYSAATIEALNSSCPSVTAFNDTRLFSVCRNETFQRLDPACWLSSCLTNYTSIVDGSAYFAPYAIGVRFLSLSSNDTGAGRLPALFAKFFAANRPAGEPPFIGTLDPAQPVQFNSTEIATRNFTISGGVYARTALISAINSQLIQKTAAARNLTSFINNVRFLPAQCPDAAIRAIPWLTPSDTRRVSVARLTAAIYSLRALYLNPQFNASAWVDNCSVLVTDGFPETAAAFCRAFPGHYTFESLNNPNASPSPYRDLEFLSRLYVQEYEDCRAPRGCLGYVLGTL